MGNHPAAFDLTTCARPNILALKPYRCARDDYEDDGVNILLDANENAYGPGLQIDSRNGFVSARHQAAIQPLISNETAAHLNRYPDPRQTDLKHLLCQFRNTHHHTVKELSPENLFVGVGSDEAIDILLRCFCAPGKDKILTCPPTYGMYAVSAQVNDLEVINVPLDASNAFSLRPAAINQTLSQNPAIKVLYICSPGNPTATLIKKGDLQEVLEHPTWNGVIVVDEAYIDFSPEGSSLAEWVTEWPNLVVMQTLSKAFGLAGIRLGIAFTSPAIARLLNNVKAPYNISSTTSALASAAFQKGNLAVMQGHCEKILQQRERMLRELPEIPGVGRFLGGHASNFLLVELLDLPRQEGGQPSNEVALAVYKALAETKGIVVRFRGAELGCFGCLRMTVGTEKEVDELLAKLRVVLQDIYQNRKTVGQVEEREAEIEANDVVA